MLWLSFKGNTRLNLQSFSYGFPRIVCFLVCFPVLTWNQEMLKSRKFEIGRTNVGWKQVERSLEIMSGSMARKHGRVPLIKVIFSTSNPGHADFEEDQETKMAKTKGAWARRVVQKLGFDRKYNRECKVGGKVPE